MSILKWIQGLLHRDTLREKCVAAYGEEFGVMMDMVNSGEAIGNYNETLIFIEMIEAVKRGNPYKQKGVINEFKQFMKEQ